MKEIEEMMMNLQAIAIATEALCTLKDNGVTFEKAVSMMMTAQKLTNEDAAHRIETWEKVSKILLEREKE